LDLLVLPTIPRFFEATKQELGSVDKIVFISAQYQSCILIRGTFWLAVE
jgi:hypothetical protein